MEVILMFAILVGLMSIPLFTDGLKHLVKALRGPEEEMSRNLSVAGFCWGLLLMGFSAFLYFIAGTR